MWQQRHNDDSRGIVRAVFIARMPYITSFLLTFIVASDSSTPLSGLLEKSDKRKEKITYVELQIRWNGSEFHEIMGITWVPFLLLFPLRLVMVIVIVQQGLLLFLVRGGSVVVTSRRGFRQRMPCLNGDTTIINSSNLNQDSVNMAGWPTICEAAAWTHATSDESDALKCAAPVRAQFVHRMKVCSAFASAVKANECAMHEWLH